jgi:hypothetical protein
LSALHADRLRGAVAHEHGLTAAALDPDFACYFVVPGQS